MALAETARRLFLRRVAVACLGLAVPWGVPRRAEAALRIGDLPPRVSLTDLEGRRIDIPATLKGQVALLHFWASWCPACRGEMRALESIYARHRGKGVLPCSIGIGEKRQSALSYLKGMTVTYPLLLDRGSATVKKFGISGIPTHCVLDRQGILRHRIHGEASEDGLDRMVRVLL
jgi:cytochrome c biogenesis protein CcmG, thiol:disulfide interchange protein DsbE